LSWNVLLCSLFDAVIVLTCALLRYWKLAWNPTFSINLRLRYHFIFIALLAYSGSSFYCSNLASYSTSSSFGLVSGRCSAHIVRAIGEKKYFVRFDNGVEKVCSSNILELEHIAVPLPLDISVPIPEHFREEIMLEDIIA
jgi:hypothetical protein